MKKYLMFVVCGLALMFLAGCLAAMRCKQNVDQSKCQVVSDLVVEFSVSYFDEHGMKHLKEVQNKK